MHRAFRSIIYTILLMLAAHSTSAHEANVRDKNSYIIGVGKSDLFPYFGHCDGKFCGLARDLLDEFATDTNIQFHYEITPVIRAQDQLQSGHIDGFFPDNPKWLANTPERAALHFSKPAIQYAEGMLVLNNQPSVGTLSTYGVLYKWELPAMALQALSTNATPLYTETTPALIGLLLKERVDAIYANYGVARHDLKQMNMNVNALIPHPAVPLDVDYYYMSALTDSSLLVLFNEWLQKNSEKASAYTPFVPGLRKHASSKFSKVATDTAQH